MDAYDPPDTPLAVLHADHELLAVDKPAGLLTVPRPGGEESDDTVLARIEALIAGWGLDEALRRAAAYHQAGADAVLIHSKLQRPDEILQFAREWEQRCPLVVVPTKFYATPAEVFRQHRPRPWGPGRTRRGLARAGGSGHQER